MSYFDYSTAFLYESENNDLDKSQDKSILIFFFIYSCFGGIELFI